MRAVPPAGSRGRAEGQRASQVNYQLGLNLHSAIRITNLQHRNYTNNQTKPNKYLDEGYEPVYHAL